MKSYIVRIITITVHQNRVSFLERTKGAGNGWNSQGLPVEGGGDWCTPCYFVPRNWRVNAESRRKTGWKRKRLANRNSSQFICQLKLQLVFQPRCIRGSQFFPSFVALHFAFFIFFSFLFTFFPSPLLISIPRFRDRRRRPTLSSSILDFLRYHPWRLLSILFSFSLSLSSFLSLWFFCPSAHERIFRSILKSISLSPRAFISRNFTVFRKFDVSPLFLFVPSAFPPHIRAATRLLSAD